MNTENPTQLSQVMKVLDKRYDVESEYIESVIRGFSHTDIYFYNIPSNRSSIIVSQLMRRRQESRSVSFRGRRLAIGFRLVRNR